MISYNFGYGIVLTDPHGVSTYEDVIEAIEEVKKSNSDTYPDWIMHFAYSENALKPQLILGMEIEVNKYMDFKAIQEQWEKLMETVPQNIKDLLATHTNEEPDVHLVAGIFE